MHTHIQTFALLSLLLLLLLFLCVCVSLGGQGTRHWVIKFVELSLSLSLPSLYSPTLLPLLLLLLPLLLEGLLKVSLL